MEWLDEVANYKKLCYVIYDEPLAVIICKNELK